MERATARHNVTHLVVAHLSLLGYCYCSPNKHNTDSYKIVDNMGQFPGKSLQTPSTTSGHGVTLSDLP